MKSDGPTHKYTTVYTIKIDITTYGEYPAMAKEFADKWIARIKNTLGIFRVVDGVNVVNEGKPQRTN
jgi:hypothetical protein